MPYYMQIEAQENRKSLPLGLEKAQVVVIKLLTVSFVF